MNEREILKKAIYKAITSGWGPWNAPIKVTPDNNFSIDGERWSLESIIFNHGFAMSLWGRDCMACKDKISHGHGPLLNECWQYHLQQMVIAPDPIKYLEANL